MPGSRKRTRSIINSRDRTHGLLMDAPAYVPGVAPLDLVRLRHVGASSSFCLLVSFILFPEVIALNEDLIKEHSFKKGFLNMFGADGHMRGFGKQTAD